MTAFEQNIPGVPNISLGDSKPVTGKKIGVYVNTPSWEELGEAFKGLQGVKYELDGEEDVAFVLAVNGQIVFEIVKK